MRRRRRLYIALLMMCAPLARANDLRIWFDQPSPYIAHDDGKNTDPGWDSGLPLGSGRLGAMVIDSGGNLRVQFNEDTLWTGGPHDYVRAGSKNVLRQLQQLTFAARTEKDQKPITDLVRSSFLSDPVRQKMYQPFGNLLFHFDGVEQLSDYVRELDLTTAVAHIKFKSNGVTFQRDVFTSYPDDALVVHLTADQPGKISFTLKMESPHEDSQRSSSGSDTLVLHGVVHDPADNNRPGESFESRVRATAKAGRISASGDELKVENADEATLTLVAATSFVNWQDISGDPAKKCEAYAAALVGKDFAALVKTHVADYQALFNRVTLDLGRTSEADKPTDQRLARLTKEIGGGAKGTSTRPTNALDADPQLAALYFQFGRYMLISASRPGSQAANLQGVWNKLLAPPWEGKYTTNINVEMNYWPAEVCNLSECASPLFDLIKDLRTSGARTAREQYGCGGWVLNHNTDLWRGTAPINNVDGVWPTGQAWLCDHLWEHWLFTKDEKFLREQAYPAFKEASQFFLDYLVKDPNTGCMVTCPSFSPEQGQTVAGPSMDNQLIRALFDATTASAEILKLDEDFTAKVREMRGRLPPDKVGAHGQLLEFQDAQPWEKQIDDKVDNNHRHMSPLWGLFPGAQFTKENDETLYDAARKLFDERGDGSTGWSYAWRMALAARVGDGEDALKQLTVQLAKRTFPNLFDKCGPFQVDGDFGACAGVAEMLVQSHEIDPKTGEMMVRLLPALPKAWKEGSIKGLRLRNGIVAEIIWKNGKVVDFSFDGEVDAQPFEVVINGVMVHESAIKRPHE